MTSRKKPGVAYWAILALLAVLAGQKWPGKRAIHDF